MEITRIIMLRETSGPPPSTGECDCGVLKNVTDCIRNVEVKVTPPKAEDAAGADADAAPAEGDAEGDAGGEMSIVDDVTMCLMTVDGRIGALYQQIFVELEEEKRSQFKDELDGLKVRFFDIKFLKRGIKYSQKY